MEFEWSNSLALLILSSLSVGLVTPVMRKFAIKFSIVDNPSESHKTHKKPIPYLGGVGIIFAVVVISYLASFFSKTPLLNLRTLSYVIFPAVVMGIVGLVDDIKKLPPFPRFLAQNIAAIFVATILVNTKTIGSPTGFPFLDFLISVLWIVALTNSINFFDNIDGGASGSVAISMATLGILCLQGGQSAIAAFSFVISGSTLGFLLWNKPPARIYMGDAGALFLGLLVASLTLRFDPNPLNRWASFSIPFFLLAIPILDSSVAITTRLALRKSPFQGGKDHLSHRLMKTGMNKRQAVYLLWLLSAFYCGFAMIISQASFRWEGLISAIAGFIWIFLYIFFFRLPGL
jgi:UDP-GlcNAc:undecaprenyl-phosphate/decaprenyl-phosphate GlcNAc-1-phosphate transferase